MVYSYRYKAKLPICAQLAEQEDANGTKSKKRFFWHSDLFAVSNALMANGFLNYEFEEPSVCVFAGKEYIRTKCTFIDLRNTSVKTVTRFAYTSAEDLEGEVAKRNPFAIAQNKAFDRAAIDFFNCGKTTVYGSSELPHIPKECIVDNDAPMGQILDVSAVIAQSQLESGAGEEPLEGDELLQID